jgi:two-component system response regulator HydG
VVDPGGRGTVIAGLPRLLAVDDDPAVLRLVERFARLEGFDVQTVGDGEGAVASLRPGLADVALVDLCMPGLDGLAVLEAIRARDPECQVVLMTGNPTIDTAVQAVKAGALDYLSKPFDFDRLRTVLRSVVEERARREAVLASEAELARRLQFCGMVGRGATMQHLFATIRRVAMHARTALITGETGTGKELVARALHDLGPRAARRYLTVNCSAIVEPLFESELFGHQRGAFTGAIAHKRGLFEEANGGTIFLDEVGELPPAAQAKLLRVLETGEVVRVGGTVPAKVDVRIIAATNRDLRAASTGGDFRWDLFYRLDVVHLHLPPLRERLEDVPYITAAFVREFAVKFGKPITGVSPRAEQLLMQWSWPGNVRELRNTVERACLIADGVALTEREIGASLGYALAPLSDPSGGEGGRTLAAFERDHIVRVLGECGGNKSEAARRLGLDRRSLYRRLDRFALRPSLGAGAPAESTGVQGPAG